MKHQAIFILYIILISVTLSAADSVLIYTNSGNFECELLCSSDSLLYVWTGLNEFDESKLKYVTALPYSDINLINLSLPYSWGKGITKIAPYALAGGVVVMSQSDLYEKPPVAQFSASSALFGLVFAVPGGALLSIASHLPKKVKNPTFEMFRLNSGIYRKYLILDHKDSRLINKIIKEVKS